MAAEVVQFYLQHRKANAKGNSFAKCRFILFTLEHLFLKREIET